MEILLIDELDNTDRHFQGQQKNEEVKYFTRKHPVILLPFIGIWLVLSCALILVFISLFSAGDVSGNLFFKSVFLIATIFFIILNHLFFLRLLNYYFEIVILTNYRVINMKKTLFIYDDKEIIDLHEIQDIKKHQAGIWPNLLNYGDLLVTVSTTSSSMVLRDLPNPEYYFNQINLAKRGYILERRKEKFGVKPSDQVPKVFPSPMEQQARSASEVPLQKIVLR